MHWPTSPVRNQLPLLYRLWAAYLRVGPRRASGGVVGGSAMFRTIAWIGQRKGNGFVTLRSPLAPHSLAIDLLDFESFNHTIDLWLEGCDESRLVSALFGSGQVFIDVGANVGVFSLHAASVAGATAEVHAFEPQPRAAAALKESVRENARSNLFVHQAIVSNEDADSLSFFVPRGGSGIGSLCEEHASQDGRRSQKITCASITLDSFFSSARLHTVDLIKIDVEGYETLVLEGAARTLRRCLPIVWFEINPSALQRAEIAQSRAFTLMESYGYTDFYDVRGLMNGDSARARPPFQWLVNVIAVAPCRREWLRSSLQPYIALPEIRDPEGVRN